MLCQVADTRDQDDNFVPPPPPPPIPDSAIATTPTKPRVAYR